MSRIVLVHWHAAEIEARAARLRSLGHDVSSLVSQDIATMQALRDAPPDAFVIDLARSPSQGRDLGVWLRGKRTTRTVPLVFVGGEPDKVQRVRELLPDAVYTGWEDVAAALAQALAHPPVKPVVPGAMDGYSGTPLPKKLGIKSGSAVALLGAPDDFEATLGDLPSGVELRRDSTGKASVVLLFATSQVDLVERFPAAAETLAEGGRLWIVWPKKASGVRTDIGEPEVRAFGLARGFVDYKISAIDATWSGLCFARRDAR